MSSGVQQWDYTHWGPLGLEAIRSLHVPAGHFRISPNRFAAGTAFPGVARAGRKYVLAGACAFTVKATTWELQSGEFLDLPEGRFYFRVLGNGPVEIVSVWELPPEFRGSRRA